MKTKLINWIKRYTESTHAKGYVVNISGGKDSTVVAALLVEAVGADKVLGILQPNGVQKDISDSIKVCEYLGIDYKVVNIEESVKSIISSIENNPTEVSNINHKIDDKTLTNIPPRIRMTVARAIAQSIGYRFAGTGNLSERYIGWFTKDGDSACDFNVIAGLTCTQVIKLGDELGLPYELVHKTPADGLTGKSDEDNFGFTYEQLDRYIMNGTSGDENIDELIAKKYVGSYHKLGVYTPMTCVVKNIEDDNNPEYRYITPWFNEDGTIELSEDIVNQGYELLNPDDTGFVHELQM